MINKINEKNKKINSNNLNYEVCKELVEELGYIKEVFKNQSIVELDDNINRDVINYYYENSYLSIVIFFY
ncbi:MAG: hypothetical protein L6V81_01785 [Clostridium sp.]|nr:MAG: hypothetical protein L6V81_01785 [Clostridium sp.]